MNDIDIWTDLDAIYILPQRLPGDIDVTQIMVHYGLTENGARNRMAQLVYTGQWEFITVTDVTSGQGKRKIIRKIVK